MERLRKISRPTSYLILLCLLSLGSYVPAARAAIVGTETVAAEQEIEMQRAQLDRMLDNEVVKSYLLANGVDRETVQSRLDGLSDAEIRALSERFDEYPAGEGFETLLILAFLAFIALLITDILGYTDIFPFVKKTAD